MPDVKEEFSRWNLNDLVTAWENKPSSLSGLVYSSTQHRGEPNSIKAAASTDSNKLTF